MINSAIFPCLWAYKDRYQRAEARCKQISQNEAVVGYMESSELYSTLALEMRESFEYVKGILESLLEPVM